MSFLKDNNEIKNINLKISNKQKNNETKLEYKTIGLFFNLFESFFQLIKNLFYEIWRIVIPMVSLVFNKLFSIEKCQVLWVNFKDRR